jgi:hypothetical protein
MKYRITTNQGQQNNMKTIKVIFNGSERPIPLMDKAEREQHHSLCLEIHRVCEAEGFARFDDLKSSGHLIYDRSGKDMTAISALQKRLGTIRKDIDVVMQ